MKYQKGVAGKIEKIVDESNLTKNLIVSFAQKKAIKHVEKIAKNSKKDYPKIDNPKTIIFNRVYSIYAESIFNEIGIAKALQLLGHNVKFYICDGKLWNCTTVFTIKNPPNKKRCETCIELGHKLLQLADLPYESYKDILKDKTYEIPDTREEREQFVYKGVDAGKHASTSTNRFYLGLSPNKTKYNYDKFLGQRLKNGLASIDVAEYSYKKDKPDILFSSHGCYSEWGGFLDYFHKNNVRYIIWNYSFGNREYIFNQNDLSLTFQIFKKEKDSLDEDEEKLVDNFINKRTSGKSEITKAYGFRPENDELEEEFSFSEYEKSFAVFPNVLWDASLARVDKCFDSVYHWLDYTIEYFKKHPKSLLIIKIHPGERTHQFSIATSKDYILENHKLTENIKIIDIDTKISPYALLDHIDAGLLYNGTMGLEMTIMGKPAIVAGYAPYHGQNISFDIDSIEHYKKYLDDPPKNVEQKRIDNGKLFAFFYFVTSRVPIRYTKRENRFTIAFDIDKFEDLLDCEEIKFAVDYILGKRVWRESKDKLKYIDI